MNPKWIPKDMRGPVEELLSLGWTYKKGGQGIKLYDPEGIYRVTVHHSPSDRRALANLHGSIRQSGWRV